MLEWFSFCQECVAAVIDLLVFYRRVIDLSIIYHRRKCLIFFIIQQFIKHKVTVQSNILF